MRNVRNVLSLFAVLSLVVIITAYLTSSKADAPHPDGNYTVMDLSFIYSEINKFMLLITPYAVGSLFVAVVGVVLVTYKIKSY